MATINDFKPAVDSRNGPALRNALVRRVIYALADTDDPTDFVANTDGAVTLGLGTSAGVYWLDPSDTTSPHDGTTVIVTSDGYRYKISDFRTPRAVLAVDEASPPGSPAIGDAYLTSAAPSGDWSSHGEEVAVYTTRGWVFAELRLGELIYVADGTRRWVYLDEDGNIQYRFDYEDDTIPDAALIGGQRRYIVESQIVNDPPGSPALGVYWIVGSSPTGAWSGEAGNIATSYDGSTWAIIPAVNGLEAYDRNLAGNYIFKTGLGWISAVGAWGKIQRVFTAGTGSTSQPGSGIWNQTGTPTTATLRRQDDVTLTHQAERIGAILRFTYRADCTYAGHNTPGIHRYYVCLFRDSEVNAVAWGVGGTTTIIEVSTVPYSSQNIRHVDIVFTLEAPDINSHTYRVGIMQPVSAAGSAISALERREFTIEESL